MASFSYEVSKFNPKPNSEYLCAICYCVLYDARMCPCHHIFCDACIKRWLENSCTCPTCRRPFSLLELKMAPPLVQNVLNSLLMDCDYKDQGCDQSIPMENFRSHVEKCEFRTVSCPNKDCTVKIIVRDLPDHKKECQHRSLQCQKKCHLMLPAFKVEDHDCFTAMHNRVGELDGLLHKHQMVLSWIRKKLNNVQLPQQSSGVQLRAFREMIEDINQYWPENQAIPLLFCGTYLAPATPAESSQARSSSDAGHDRENESQLERLVAEASNTSHSPRVFGPRDPGGADGPTAHIVRDSPVRGIVHEEDDVRDPEYSSDESNPWDDNALPNRDSNGYHGSLISVGVTDPAVATYTFFPYTPISPTREAMGYGVNTQQQGSHFADGIVPSPEQPRSVFDQYQSYRTLDSSGNYSSFSDQENQTSTTQSSHRYQSSSSYANTGYDMQHVENDDPAYSDWSYMSPQTDYGPHHADTRYYSRSRSRSFSPSDVRSHGRHSESFSSSPRGPYSPSSESSYSPGRNFSHSRNRSDENSETESGRTYDRSCSSILHSRSRSRSDSRSRGSSSRSRDHQSRITNHQRNRSHSQSCSSCRSSSTSSLTEEDQFSDPGFYTRTDDTSNGPIICTPDWENDDEASHANWGGCEKGVDEELRGVHDNFIPVQCPSPMQGQRRSADSTSAYFPYGSHHLNVGDTDKETCEQNGPANTLSDENVSDRNHLAGLDTVLQSHPSPPPVAQTSYTKQSLSPQIVKTSGSKTQDPVLSCENTAETQRSVLLETGMQERIQQAVPGCSYTRDDTNAFALENSESDQIGLSKVGSSSARKISSEQEAFRNVWESSSDTTSLDYEIPADDSTPKAASQPDSDAEWNKLNEGVESTGNGISAESGNESESTKVCDVQNVYGSSSIKDSSKHGGYDTGDDSVSSHFDTNTNNQKTKGKGIGSNRKAPLKTPGKSVASDDDSDIKKDSDSDVCFKRKMKVKLPDTSSDSESFFREKETNVKQNQCNEDGASKAITEQSLPSTSRGHPSSKAHCISEGKAKRKKKEKSTKKDKLKHSPGTLDSKAVSHPKHELKTKRKLQKSKNHSPTKRARQNDTLHHKEGGEAVQNVSNKSVHMEHSGARLKHCALSSMGSGALLTTHSHALTTSHADEGTDWASLPSENRRRSAGSHTFSRSELERTDNGTDIDLSTSSRGRRHSQRHVEAEGRQGSERTIESGSLRRAEDVGVQGISTHHQERERGNAPAHTSGRRIMRLENVYRKAESRQLLPDETRSVLISDLPVPPTTLELLNQYCDDSDSTWSPSSSQTESSGTV